MSGQYTNLSWILDGPNGQVPFGSPESIAVAMGASGERLTYGELRERRNAYAMALLDYGVRAGDRVGLFLFNSVNYIALYLSIVHIGAIAVRLNFRLSPRELVYVINDSGCKVVFVDNELVDVVEKARSECNVKWYFTLDDACGDSPGWLRPFEVGHDSMERMDPIWPTQADGAMIMYTSGTTGYPKGALWTHGNSLWFGAMQAMKWGYNSSTTAMTTGPLYHIGAFEDLLLPALLSHGTAVCMPSRNFSISGLLSTFQAQSVTDVLLYPFMLYDLLRCDSIGQYDVSALRRIVCGGDSIMPWAIERMRERLPGVELVQAYGLTEGGGMSTCLDDADCERHPDSVGRPLPLTEVRVINDSGDLVANGEVGEIIVRSPSVCVGYWGKPEDSEEVFAAGWCRTGDLGMVSEDGFLVVTGRMKDMIRSGGENIYPAEVEAVLTRHEDVREAAVVAVPDRKYVEVPCAVLVANGTELEGDTESVRTYCRRELAHYKCPRYFVWVTELPRNGSGKILKHVLRDEYREIGEKANI